MRANNGIHRSPADPFYFTIETTLAVIECTKEGIKFSCEGEAGKGGITLKAGGSVNSVSEIKHARKKESMAHQLFYVCA